MKKPADVDSYIMQAPQEVREMLVQLRRVIKKAAPKATERISYGMPSYVYGGSWHKGWLVSFAAFKKHVSIFISPSLRDVYPKELEVYHATKAAFHFPFNKPFPFALMGRTVRTLVRHIVLENKKISNSIAAKGKI